jgi:crossover junction endodeoxyribonuclease RusA
VSEVRIPLPWTSPPLHSNQRLHWAAKARETARIREIVAWQAKGQTITPPVEVELLWTVNDKRHRDADNPMPTTKACIDGCRDAGLLAEDHTGIVVRSFCSIVQGPAKGMALIVREVR